jgi:hypothetical protein
LNLPNSGKALVDPTSFSLTPSSVTNGSTYNTYVWNQPSTNVITFNMDLTGVNPGDVPIVVASGQMNYTLPSLGPGTYVLSPLTAFCNQIMTVSPASQAIQNAGGSATYAVTLSNPTATSQTFLLSVLGLPASWVSQPAGVTVAAGGSQTYNLVINTPLNATPTTFSFFAVATTSGGITASVGASVSIYYVPNSGSGNVNTGYIAFTGTINPSQVTVGQQGAAQFQVTITNTGTAASYIAVGYASGYALPGGWQINFTPTYGPTVQPGLNNAYTITGNLQLPPTYYNSTNPGTYTIPLQVQYYNQTPVNIPLTVNVVGPGVYTYLNPASGPPNSSFVLTVNNVGTVSDTYTISVEGQMAQVATVSTA